MTNADKFVQPKMLNQNWNEKEVENDERFNGWTLRRQEGKTWCFEIDESGHILHDHESE